MSNGLIVPSDDEDVVWLFERIVEELSSRYKHSKQEAHKLVNEYLGKFMSKEFCDAHDFPVETLELIRREEALTMADRVHFYEFLDNPPNEDEFIQWQRAMRILVDCK